ncbi:MAG: hypothetical protein R3F43_33185, partial [bacterium]
LWRAGEEAVVLSQGISEIHEVSYTNNTGSTEQAWLQVYGDNRVDMEPYDLTVTIEGCDR